MERASKLFVIGWMCAALAAELWLSRAGWPSLAAWTVAVGLGAASVCALDRRMVGIVVALAYVAPALVRAFHGAYTGTFDIVWVAAAFGAIAPRALRTSWSIPPRWRVPLVCWVYVVIAGAMLVLFREMDFYPPTILEPRIAIASGGGGGLQVESAWTLKVASEFVLGVLWFDWLFGAADADLAETIGFPMACGAGVLAALAVYQWRTDLLFFNETPYGVLGRASGTMYDANVAGVIAALWIGGVFLATARMARGQAILRTIAFVLGWLGVWATGSRTGFGAAAIVSAFIAYALWRDLLRIRRRVAFGAAVAAACALVAGVGVVARYGPALGGPAARIAGMIPEFQLRAVAPVARELWTRNRYGNASTAMIREYPWFGVGPGFFSTFVSDFAVLTEGEPLAPDNAQNWARHELAELGVVGSLPWIVWTISFAAFVLRPRRGATAVLVVARGIVVAFAAVSMVGMPSQNVAAAITFWTFAFWFVWQAGAPEPARARHRTTWVAAAAIVVAAFSIGTLREATVRLRPRFRAQAAGWPYTYGLYPAESVGRNGEAHWTKRRAVAVVAAPTRWIELSISAKYDDVIGRVVKERVWRDGELVVDGRISSAQPTVKYARIPDRERWVVLETAVDRTLRPRSLGYEDDRELGLRVEWRFVDAPPAGDRE